MKPEINSIHLALQTQLSGAGQVFCWPNRGRAVAWFVRLRPFEAASAQVDLRESSVPVYLHQPAYRLSAGLSHELGLRFHSRNHDAATDHLSACIASRERQGVGQQSVSDGIFS